MRRPRLSAPLVVAITLVAVVGGLLSHGAGHPGATAATPSRDDARAGSAGSAGGAPDQPNMILVVMDDFSVELLATMTNVRRMQRQGATYPNTFVVNTLCCPSRAAMFTGLPPHLNGVLTNTSSGHLGPKGGWPAFRSHQGPRRSYNVSLRAGGYRTGFVGKYLNEYEPRRRDGRRTAPPLVQGWDDFEAVSGGAYDGWGFVRTKIKGDHLVLRNHRLPARTAPRKAKDRLYAGEVIADRAVALVRRYRDSDRPYFLHVAPYGPHSRLKPAWPGEPLFPAAFRDRPHQGRPHGNCGARSCAALSLRDLKGYRDPRGDNAPYYLDGRGRTRPAPSWRTNEVTLSNSDALRHYRDRARMVQSIDRMIGRLRAAAGPNTYVFVTSDNGYHLGQHSLNGGKGTPYDSDTRVPLVVVGPDVQPGSRSQFVSSLDLASTFEELAGRPVTSSRAGSSFAPTLAERRAPGGRYTFVEHTYGPTRPGEPDGDPGSGGRLDIIPSYVAVRGARGLLVRVDLDRSWRGTRYAWELYRYDRPWEARNVFAEDHDKAYARDLMRRLRVWDGCRPRDCRALTR